MASQKTEDDTVIIFINETLCKGAVGCGICVAFCPKDVFGVAERLTNRGIRSPVVRNLAACTNCQNCVIYCPDMAMVVQLEEPQSAPEALLATS